MLCLFVLPTVWLRGSGFEPTSTLCYPYSDNPRDLKGADGMKLTHRASGAPSYGSGAYYSMRSPALLSTKESVRVSSFRCGQCDPIATTATSLYFSTEQSNLFPAIPGTAAYDKGARYQSGWCIRDGYVFAVSCYNFDWYRWRYSVFVAPLPTEVTITTRHGDPYISTNGWYGKACVSKFPEKNPATMETFMNLLFHWSPEYIQATNYLDLNARGQVDLLSNAVWGAARYGSTSVLSRAVYGDYVPSEYMKAVSTAYYAALRRVPSIGLNPLTTISDVKSLANSKLHVIQERLGALKGASADYLQYRYGFKTAAMDMQDLESMSSRLEALLGQEMVCNGYATAKDGTVVHVTLRYTPSQTYDMLVWSSPLKRLQQRLLVDTWDAIPFSFIVDWLVDVEGYLTDVSNLLVNETWHPSEIWVSFKSSTPGVTYEYARVHGHSSLASTSLGLSDYVAEPSNRGIFYHIADGLAIVTQMVG